MIYTVGRVLVRPSGTEPKIRIMVEAPEESVAIKFVKDIENLIRSKFNDYCQLEIKYC